MTLSVRVAARADEVPPALWEVGFAPPLEGVWWYRGLEASGLEDQFSFSYAVVEDEGRPVALAPMFIADIPMEMVAPEWVMPALRFIGRLVPGVMAQRTLFVGSPFSDEGTMGFMPGVDRAAALLAVARAMDRIAREQKAWMLVWKDFPDTVKPEMDVMAKRAGFFATVGYPGTVVRFTSDRRADYEAGMKPSHRHNLRKRLRRSAEAATLATDVIQHPDEATLDEIFGLFMQTYSRAETKFERLDRRYFEVFAALPQAYFLIQREAASGAMVAFMLCLKSGDLVINKFIGLDYGRDRDWSLYFRLTSAAVDWALSIGAKALQSGQTGYRPKLELGHSLQPLFNYARHRNPLIHAIYAFVGKDISWASLDPQLAGREEA